MDGTCSKPTNLVIGFTVGVWDLFHEGHKNFLERCRNHCDYLIVGVMTDYWVRVQKGDDRPVDSLEVRSFRVGEFGDKIIALDTLDMSAYLQIADVWIKSEGQTKMRPDVFRNIITLKRTRGVSTTEIINAEKTYCS